MTLRQESPGARTNAETLDCIFITLKREEHSVAFSALGRDNVGVITAKRTRGAHAILKRRIERANNHPDFAHCRAHMDFCARMSVLGVCMYVCVFSNACIEINLYQFPLKTLRIGCTHA